MQIKLRYQGARPEALKGLTALLRQAGYIIRVDASKGRQSSRASGVEIRVVEKKDPPKGRPPGQSSTRPRTVVTSVTGRREGGRGATLSAPAPAVNLRSLRESAGKTQAQVARLTEMSQPQLSRLESRQDHLISTLRKYVRALGGEIEVMASIGGRSVPLRDV